MENKFLDELKNYLNITWDEDFLDKKLESIISRAVPIISDFAGYDFTAETIIGAEKQLLLDLCRYIYNNAYEDFAVNFSSELVALRNKYAVLAYEEENSC